MRSETIKPAKLSDAVADHPEVLIPDGGLAKLADRQTFQANLQGISFISRAIGSSLGDPLVVRHAGGDRFVDATDIRQRRRHRLDRSN